MLPMRQRLKGGSRGGEKEKNPSNAQKSKSQNKGDLHASQTSNIIVTSLNLVFQRAPVIPNYVWELLKRCHPYFGNDTVSYSHIIKSIVRDMLPVLRLKFCASSIVC